MHQSVARFREMGYGDDIMATAEAAALARAGETRPIAIGDGNALGASCVYLHNPRLARPAGPRGAGPDDVVWLRNYPGHRPYIDYADMGATPAERYKFKHRRERPLVWTDWRVPGPGEIYFTPDEQRRIHDSPARGAVSIEPTVKPRAMPGKDWGAERWQAVADTLRRSGHRVVQFGPANAVRLDGVEAVVTKDFRDALIALAAARLHLGPEGGLHHAAAALGVPAVVYFGGCVPPSMTGYAFHENLYFEDPRSPCGMRVACDHCDAARLAITPFQVCEAARRLLR